MVKLFFWWSSYHFCGQTFGITMIYARRAGFSIGKWERLGLNAFIYGSFLVSSFVRRNPARLPARVRLSFMASSMKRSACRSGCHSYSCVSVGRWRLFLVLAIRWSIERNLLPPIILVPAAAVHLVRARWRLVVVLRVRAVLPLHAIPADRVVDAVKEKMDLKQIEPSAQYVVGESVLGVPQHHRRRGAVLFPAAGRLGHDERVPPSQLLDAMRDLFLNMGAPHTAGLPFYIGVTIIAVQIHHFFVDGVIWKLGRKSVSSPLMVNLHDMLEPAHAG